MKNIYTKSKLFPVLIILMGIFLLPEKASLAGIYPEKIIELTNQERQKNETSFLIINESLTRAANKKAEAIFKTQIFKHDIDNKKFSSWIKEVDYNYSFVGENLAIDFLTNEGVIKAWLNSPTHKKNLLNDNFREIGVAVVDGEFKGTETTLVVQIFGTPLNYFPDTQIAPEKINQPFLNENKNIYNVNDNENLITHSQLEKNNDKKNNTFVILKSTNLKFDLLFNNFYLKIFSSLLLIYSFLSLLYFWRVKFLKQKRQNDYYGQEKTIISENI